MKVERGRKDLKGRGRGVREGEGTHITLNKRCERLSLPHRGYGLRESPRFPNTGENGVDQAGPTSRKCQALFHEQIQRYEMPLSDGRDASVTNSCSTLETFLGLCQIVVYKGVVCVFRCVGMIGFVHVNLLYTGCVHVCG